MKYFIILLLVSIILFNNAYKLKILKRFNDNTEIWKINKLTSEKKYWILSIIFFIFSFTYLFFKITKKNKNLFLFYVGFFFLLVHMFGEWFLRKCDFQVKRHENTFKQYFVDNILGNLTIKKDTYENSCDIKNMKKISGIIINRNLSIFFLFLFLLSIHFDIPFFGKTKLLTVKP